MERIGARPSAASSLLLLLLSSANSSLASKDKPELSVLLGVSLLLLRVVFLTCCEFWVTGLASVTLADAEVLGAVPADGVSERKEVVEQAVKLNSKA